MGLFTLSNNDISGTSRPITIKFYQKHHLGRGKTALCFLLDRVRQNSGVTFHMTTNSSHRFIMGGNIFATLVPLFLIGSSSFLQVMMTTIKYRMSSKFG